MDLNHPIESRSLVEEISARLVAAILSGEIPLGSKLKEEQIAQNLGVSRGPVREAMRHLEGRKLIERVPNLGPRVISLSPEDLSEIYLLRIALEGIACRTATLLMTDEDLAGLKALVDLQFSNLENSAASFSVQADLDFHQRIAQGARSPKLLRLMRDELFYPLQIYRARSEATPGRGRRALEEHRAILNAMLQRDPDAAENCMRAHIEHARNALARRTNGSEVI